MARFKNNRNSETVTFTSKVFWYLPLYAAVVIILLTAVKAFQISQAIAEGSKKGPPAMSVTTSVVRSAPWHSIVRTVGNVEADQGAMLSAEEAGRISRIHQSDGSSVKKNDLIIEIDASVEVSEYKSALAQSELLRKTFERQKRLYSSNAISADEYDTAELNYKASVAQAEALKSRIDRKQIRAPFDGTLGVRRVTIGQYVRQGDPLIPLQDTSNIYVTFSLSQNDSRRVKPGDSIKVKHDSHEASGRIIAIDPSISPGTKTALVKATLNDESTSLLPGSFVHIEVNIDDERDLFTIPSTSIQYAPFGDSIYIVEDSVDDEGTEKKVANPVFIKVLDRRGDIAAIEGDISENTEIISSGTFKLFPGAQILVNNKTQPPQSTDPKPENR
jgi:membrane fusion protein, multidrug efflux system